MGARRNINRYKTEPFGKDFEDVVRRAKAFFKDGTFFVSEFNGVYTASRPSLGFKDPANAIYFTKQDRNWSSK